MPSRRERIVLLSTIAAQRAGDRWRTLDLWARDLATQSDLLDITLICPESDQIAGALAPIAPGIEVIAFPPSVPDARLRAILSGADYLQIPGNFGWRPMKLGRRMLAIARSMGIVSLLGISSNRAKTAILNARGRGPLAMLKGLVRYADIRLTQRCLAKKVSGIFVVGEGLTALIADCNDNIHVGTASWIKSDEIVIRSPTSDGDLRVCLAGRLEYMKGFDIGLEAVAMIDAPLAVTVIGAGPEEATLKAQAARLGLQSRTRFLVPVSYPDAFFAVLDAQDIVLLPNRSDEQPRLIFDAISRGCIPICPDKPAYRALGLDDRLYCRPLDPADLARAIVELRPAEVRAALLPGLRALAAEFTLDTMHRKRRDWMRKLPRP
jgi:glycosyltransferase involved in cell wall biosynthesis